MIVKELIKKLREVDGNARVLVENNYDVSLGSGYEGAGPSDITGVKKQSDFQKKHNQIYLDKD